MILFSLFITQVVGAQIISKPESRSELLDGMNRSLSNIQQEEREFAGTRSPFVAVMPEKEVAVVEDVKEDTAPVRVEILPDNQALAIVSQQFKPLGSLIFGNRGVLQLQDNSTIERGATFNAEIRGHTYKVKILDVTSSGYTLQLGSAQISKNFLTTSGAAK